VPKDSSPVTNNEVSSGPTVRVRPTPHDKTKPHAPGTLYQQIMYADDDSICYPMPSGSGVLSSADLAVVAKSGTPPLTLHPCDTSNDADESIHQHENLGAPSDHDNPTLDLTSEHILKMSPMPDTESTDPDAQVPAVKKSSRTKNQQMRKLLKKLQSITSLANAKAKGVLEKIRYLDQNIQISTRGLMSFGLLATISYSKVSSCFLQLQCFKRHKNF